MTKNEIAMQINCIDNIGRTLILDERSYFTEGQIYNNRDKAESWQSSDANQSFECELDGKYIYFLRCNNVPCHKVDYDNEEEVKVLNAYENECEVLVPANTNMKIVSVSTDDDYEEMGYYEVELELIEN
jgi:hypothetical protein